MKQWCVAARYDKYDKPMDKRRVTNGEDPFLDEMDHMEAQVEDLNKVSTAIPDTWHLHAMLLHRKPADLACQQPGPSTAC